MNHLTHRTFLRLSTALVVMLGLLAASAALASPPLQERAEADPEVEAEVYGEEDTTIEGERAELSGDVEDFVEFVEEHQQEGIDDIYEYTDKGANHLADALKELLPDDADDYRQSVDNWEDRLGVLGNEDRPQFSALTSQLFVEGAELFTNIQESFYPGMEAHAEEVTRAAQAISAEEEITAQVDRVENFFVANKDGLIALVGADAQPVTQAPFEVTFARHPVIAQQEELPPLEEETVEEEDEGFLGWGGEDADLSRQVRNFKEFVQEHQEEGIDHVADYTRDGAMHFHDAMEDLLDDVEDDTLALQLDRYKDRAEALQDQGREGFPQELVDTLTEGTQVLTSIQQGYYPGQDGEIRELETNLAQINTTAAIEEQVDGIQNFFVQASATTEAMNLAGPTLPAPEARNESPIVLVGDYGDKGERHDEGDIGGGPMLEPEVQSYLDFSEGLTADAINEETVVEGMRHLQAALGTFVDEEPVALHLVQMDEEEPWMDPPGEPGMEEPGMEEPATGMLTEQYNELVERIDTLEGSVGDEAFGENLQEALSSAGDVLSTLQSENYPELGEKLTEVQSYIDNIDADTSVEDQADAVVSVFTSSSELAATMCENRHQMDEPMDEQVFLL